MRDSLGSDFRGPRSQTNLPSGARRAGPDCCCNQPRRTCGHGRGEVRSNGAVITGPRRGAPAHPHPAAAPEVASGPFAELGVAAALVRATAEMGYTEPTPVQSAAIPPALAGSDILASAATGSGKSAAFGLPVLQALMTQPRGTTRALVLAPTRELAAQIAAHLEALAKHTRVRVAAIYGGVGFGPQIAAFKQGTDIIVATPGRLLDVLAQHSFSFAGITHLVIDEADRMLDMGFLPAVRRVLKYLPAQRQTLFFSATLPAEILALSTEMLRDPVRVSLAPPVATAEGIEQFVYTVPGDRKGDLLLELLKDGRIFSAIAFTRTKSRANRLCAFLDKNGIPVDRIHGDRSQAQRTRALADLKRAKIRILVATDIAARGIDVVDLGHVLNYDVPLVPEDYVHRIGRTGRASATGEAITFVSSEEEKFFAQIERALGKRLARTKTPDLGPPSAPPPVPPRPPRAPRQGGGLRRGPGGASQAPPARKRAVPAGR